MDPQPHRFRPHVQVVTERTRPEPIFVVAHTGTACWLRLDIAPDILARSPNQRQRGVGAAIRTHFAAQKGIAGPFGRITGFVFRSLPERGFGYNVEGKPIGLTDEPVRYGEASLGLR